MGRKVDVQGSGMGAVMETAIGLKIHSPVNKPVLIRQVLGAAIFQSKINLKKYNLPNFNIPVYETNK